MLNFDKCLLENLYTWQDITDFATYRPYEEFEIIIPQDNEWGFKKIVPEDGLQLQQLLQLEDITVVVTSGDRMNPQLERLYHHLVFNNPDVELLGFHLYASNSSKSVSFTPHADKPHNIILQIEGETEWIRYNEFSSVLGKTDTPEMLTEAEHKILQPGEMIYLPSRQYHCAKTFMPRLSLSILYI